MLKKNVVLAIMAGILSGCTWSCSAYAEEDTAAIVPSKATKTININSNNKDMFKVTVYGAGDGLDIPHGEDILKSNSTLDASLQSSVINGITYWSDMLAANAKNKQPLEILVGTNTEPGADASSLAFVYDKQEDDLDIMPITAPARLVFLGADEKFVNLQKFKATNEGAAAIGIIHVGTSLGCAEDSTSVDGFAPVSTSVLAQNGKATDLTAVIRHEMGHALGISTDVEGVDANGNPVDDDDDDDDDLNLDFVKAVSIDDIDDDDDEKAVAAYRFSQNGFEGNANSYTSHLVDINGTKAALNMTVTNNPEEEGFLVDSNNYAYFQGKNVKEVLGAAALGIPVWGYEDGKPELSHLELKNVLMSHQYYRNYTTFTEAELAVMQDIGYAIDRRNYFGASVYEDNQKLINKNGYFARNEAGSDYVANTYNTTAYGIGLHVYGSNNDITQAADIMTKGYGAAGIRIDGEGNTITVAKGTAVHADGENNMGLLVAYGKEQNVKVDGVVTAKGANGNAIHLDFGSHVLGQGNGSEYRGSYMRYFISGVAPSCNLDVTEAASAYTMNEEVIGRYEANELNGELVSSLNISGTVEGKNNAIYIGKGAFVKEINLEEKAQIKGNITSDWKHLEEVVPDSSEEVEAEPLIIQYDGNMYGYGEYIPALVTDLNVLGDVSFKDNIYGSDNMKLKVQKGTFSFAGEAELVGVTVEKDGKLIGGTYKLQDMTADMATGFSDTTTGKLINKGTIGAALPADKATDLAIKGDLVLSDNSSLQFTANKKLTGTIKVNGSVLQEGKANITVDAKGQYVPGTYSVLLENGADYALALNENEGLYKTGLLTASYDDNSSKLVFAMENNLGDLSKGQKKSLVAVENMLEKNQDDTLINLLNADATTTKKVLQQLGQASIAKMAGLTQRSGYAQGLVGKRLNSFEAAKASVDVKVTPNQLTVAKTAVPSTEMRIQVPVEAENNLWASIDKGWGEAAGGNSHSYGMALGYDKQYNDYNRAGAFFGYNQTSFSGEGASDKLKDYRLGFYNGYKKDNGTLQTYIDFGSQHHEAKHSMTILGSGKGTYQGKLVELGAEYKYVLPTTKAKAFQVAPYLNGKLSRYWQDSYQESGLGVFNKSVEGYNSNYAATELGLEIGRKLPKGHYSFRAGYKEVWTGADPALRFSYAGDRENSYRNNAAFDKHFLTASLNGSVQLTPKWSVEGDANVTKGAHDKDYSASAVIKYQW